MQEIPAIVQLTVWVIRGEREGYSNNQWAGRCVGVPVHTYHKNINKERGGHTSQLVKHFSGTPENNEICKS